MVDVEDFPRMVPTAHLDAAHRLGKVLCGLPQLVHIAPFPVEFVPIHGRDVWMESVEQVVDGPSPDSSSYSGIMACSAIRGTSPLQVAARALGFDGLYGYADYVLPRILTDFSTALLPALLRELVPKAVLPAHSDPERRNEPVRLQLFFQAGQLAQVVGEAL